MVTQHDRYMNQSGAKIREFFVRKPNVHKSWHKMKAAIDAMPANSVQQIAQKISAKKDLKFVMADSDVTRSVQDNLAQIQQVNR